MARLLSMGLVNVFVHLSRYILFTTTKRSKRKMCVDTTTFHAESSKQESPIHSYIHRKRTIYFFLQMLVVLMYVHKCI